MCINHSHLATTTVDRQIFVLQTEPFWNIYFSAVLNTLISIQWNRRKKRMPISGIRESVKEKTANKEVNYKHYSNSLNYVKEDDVIEKLHAWGSGRWQTCIQIQV